MNGRHNRQDWAYRKRQQLLDHLGRRCANCGDDEVTAWERTGAGLEFDHPHGRDWQPRELNAWRRIARYWRDARAGNLRVLCKTCNGTEGSRRYWAARRRRVAGA